HHVHSANARGIAQMHLAHLGRVERFHHHRGHLHRAFGRFHGPGGSCVPHVGPLDNLILPLPITKSCEASGLSFILCPARNRGSKRASRNALSPRKWATLSKKSSCRWKKSS